MLALSSRFIQNPVILHYFQLLFPVVQATSIFFFLALNSLLTDLLASTTAFSLQSLFLLKRPEWSFKNPIKSVLCSKLFNGFFSLLSKSSNSLNGLQGLSGLVPHYTTNLLSQILPLHTLLQPHLPACLNLLVPLSRTLAPDTNWLAISGLSWIPPYWWLFPWPSF